jgi:hypothetical protein
MAFDRSVFDWLVGGGGQTPGLLEDIEWQARLMLADVSVGFAERARVYDEKTGRADQLGRQRKRWVAGIAIAARSYGLRLLGQGLRHASPRLLVAAFGVTKLPRSLLLAALLALGALGLVWPAAPSLLPAGVWLGLLGSMLLYVLGGMLLDGARPSAYRALACAPLFMAIMFGATFAGMLRASRQSWVPTTHQRGITADQLADHAG